MLLLGAPIFIKAFNFRMFDLLICMNLTEVPGGQTETIDIVPSIDLAECLQFLVQRARFQLNKIRF